MMMAQNATDGKLGKLPSAATDLFDYVRRAAEDGKAVHEVEEGVWQQMLQMGREAVGQFLEYQGDGDWGETLTMPDGHHVKRLEESRLRCYQSIFGEFQLQRAVYGCNGPCTERARDKSSSWRRWTFARNCPRASFPACCKTGRRRGQKIACLMDGQPSLWAVRKQFLPGDNAVEILDLLHVTPRLWEAACLFHREGSEAAASFVRERLLRVLRGEAGYVIGGLRQMGTKHGPRGRRLAKPTTVRNYLSKNIARMRYDEYLAAGYPIASGVIEGACRCVVKDRMERAGMRWTVEGARAMLAPRTTFVNGQWQAFQKYRIRQERQRLYPQRKWLKQATWSLVA